MRGNQSMFLYFSFSLPSLLSKNKIHKIFKKEKRKYVRSLQKNGPWGFSYKIIQERERITKNKESNCSLIGD